MGYEKTSNAYLQTWFERTMRIGLITILLAAIFHGHSPQTDKNAASLLRTFGCLTLFSAGMVLKTLAAKILSSHFNKASFFDKMQDALRKVSSPLRHPASPHVQSITVFQQSCTS